MGRVQQKSPRKNYKDRIAAEEDDSLLSTGVFPLIPSVHACLCVYAENLEELENCFTTFKGGPTWCPVRLSIMLDGHTAIADKFSGLIEAMPDSDPNKEKKRAMAEAKLQEEPWTALRSILGFDDNSARVCGIDNDVFSGLIYSGQVDAVPFDLYVKGSVLPRGKRQSHRVFFKLLEENIRNGTVDRPMAIFCTDADTGSRKGLVEVGRMVDVLMANPGVAALSTSIRVGNFSLLNPLTMTQVIDYSIIKYGFGGQSFWRSTQACIGMAVMYNYELLVQKPEHGGQSVLERYTKPFSESFFELVTLDMVEDQGMSVFCIEAGLGCMFSHSTNFYTYVPDTIDEFFGQRRRWIEGWIVGPTHFYFCSTGFFTMRFWRFPYWLATCWTQFYVLGLMPALMVSTTATLMGTKWPITNQCRPDMLAAVSADNLPCACSSFYLGWLQNMTAHGITGIYLENERLPGCGASWPRCDNVCSSDLGDSLFLQANGYNVTFYGMWAFMLLFCFHAMDTTPKGWLMTTTDAQGQSRTWFSWLHLYCGITFCFTIFFWVIMIDLVHQSNPYGLNEYVSLYGVNLGDTDSPVLAWSMSFVATLVFYLILHEPCYWFQVVCGFISSCFTGAICGGTPSIQNPLVILYTFANLDSTNWGTRATADHGLYAGGDQDTTAYKTSLWWTKVGLTTLWLSLNVVVSFLCVYSYILWGDYLGPEIYGYPWLSWPAFFATYAILGGRYLDWAVGRLILFHRERARQMPQEDALGGFLGTLLGLRVMSCELPCHRDLRGTHCDTSAFKAEVGTTQARVARWSWDADRAPGALGEKDNYSLKATSSYGSYDNIADGNSSRNKTSPGVDVELGDQMAARPASPL